MEPGGKALESTFRPQLYFPGYMLMKKLQILFFSARGMHAEKLRLSKRTTVDDLA